VTFWKPLWWVLNKGPQIHSSTFQICIQSSTFLIYISLTKCKPWGTNEADDYSQKLVIETHRKKNSGLGAPSTRIYESLQLCS
jgi:hypothetical protein